ncbi:NAD-dependent epimerase/dehydratase family protein [Flavobacterium alkalisoli]|uniref:NAD-dependent epimerase/dehydratase family protein n=1 Tax=Flavobacterium alkalisoli TaxID=2602769 RepID=A0A5B9FQY7_9FLAO|nr:NAD(P)H-binding protein [Flavobacterium alkalisoli]QEE49384.1 NAD-dependent epimerase/dehydratase family protein [Flavobacterium alkalisoli]
MKPSIKIAVIGATGKAGKFLIKELAKTNYQIKALVRNPENTNLSTVEVITGNVSTLDDVLSLLKDCDAVISVLGMGVSPNPTDIFTTSTGNILSAMKKLNIKRYIVITGLNVDTPTDSKSPNSKAATNWMYEYFPATTKNKQEEYEMLTESSTDWTMVRLPMIDLTEESPEIAISLTNSPGNKISATSLAQFLIKQLTDEAYIRQAPFIANQ